MATQPSPTPQNQNLAARPDPSLLKKRRPGRNAFLVYGLEILLVLGILCVPLYALVKVGALQFSGSSFFYHPPQPPRVVQTSSVLTTADLARLVESRLRASAARGVQSTYVVTLSEEELTAAVRGIIVPPLAQAGWKGQNVQVVLLPGEADVSGRWTKSILHIDLLVRGQITSDKTQIRYEPTSIQIGEVNLSKGQLDWLVEKVSGKPLTDWTFGLNGLTLASVRTLSRQLELSFFLPST